MEIDPVLVGILAAVLTFLISHIVANRYYQVAKAKIHAVANALQVLDAAMEDDKISKEEAVKIYEAFRAVVNDP